MTALAQTRRGLRMKSASAAFYIRLKTSPARFFGSFTSTWQKWRFASLPDLWNILRVVTVLALSLLVLDYILLRRTLYDQTSSLLAFNGTRRPTYLLILYQRGRCGCGSQIRRRHRQLCCAILSTFQFIYRRYWGCGKSALGSVPVIAAVLKKLAALRTKTTARLPEDTEQVSREWYYPFPPR